MDACGQLHAPVALPLRKQPVSSTKYVHLFIYVSGSQPEVATPMRLAVFLSEYSLAWAKCIQSTPFHPIN
jgi:hypothetical protein